MRSSCLFSTVKNTSGGAKTFGFLPPHGRRLGISEEFTCFGNILEAIIRDERVTGRRQQKAFEAAISRGDIEILSTPNPILEDENGTVQMLILKDGVLSQYDPCWESYASPDDPEV
jgi:hypothetical protein